MLQAPKLTGFADEASRDLGKQIQATKDIGWSAISARMIGDHNIHEMPEADFEAAADQLDAAGIRIPEFGSLIGNWAKKIDSDFDITLAEVERAIPRMKRLGTQLVRIMSYAQNPWGEDQQEQERFRRLREIVARFSDAGLTAIHENCMNWGGFSAEHTLRLVEEIPGLKLVFDTGNPVFQRDRSKPEPFPWQDAFEFWEKVRDHVVHIHRAARHHRLPRAGPLGRRLAAVLRLLCRIRQALRGIVEWRLISAITGRSDLPIASSGAFPGDRGLRDARTAPTFRVNPAPLRG